MHSWLLGIWMRPQGRLFLVPQTLLCVYRMCRRNMLSINPSPVLLLFTTLRQLKPKVILEFVFYHLYVTVLMTILIFPELWHPAFRQLSCLWLSRTWLSSSINYSWSPWVHMIRPHPDFSEHLFICKCKSILIRRWGRIIYGALPPVILSIFLNTMQGSS